MKQHKSPSNSGGVSPSSAANATASSLGGSSPSTSVVAADPHDLVVLEALGKNNKMAKSISLSTNGSYVISNHDGRKIYMVRHSKTKTIHNVLDAARVLGRVGTNEFVLRGGLGRQFRRILHSKPNAPATIVDVPRSYVFFDIDGASGVIKDYDPRVREFREAHAGMRRRSRRRQHWCSP